MPDFKTTDLLNAIRNEASADYTARVPLATRENLLTVGTAILDYNQTRNEFVSALVNRIALVVVKNKLFTNPLTEFKKGTLDWGKDIEEVFVDLIKSQSFDADLAESQVFKKVPPNVTSVFHRLNRQDMYKTTINREQLKMAFLSENGFTSLIDKITQALYTSDNYDEYLIMKHLIEQYGAEGKFAMITVSPVSDEATAKVAMAKIKEVSNTITFMKKDYNYAGVTTNTDKADQIILIDTKFDAIIDVELLASAFNMSKADFTARRVLVDDFGGLTNVLCALVDRDWFMVYDKEITSEEIYNPEGLYYNYFLHHWQVMSCSPFANAILFVTVAPTLTSISLTPATATVAKGGFLQMVIEAVGTNNPPASVVYTHNGTAGITAVSTTGLLVVGKSESVGTITVTATSKFDGSKTDTCVVTVV